MESEFHQEIDFLISQLMLFYKGGVSYSEFQTMPYSKILVLRDHAGKITDKFNAEIDRQSSSIGKGGHTYYG